MSSAGVYGPTDVLPLSEENPGDPNSRHKEKLQCEAWCCVLDCSQNAMG